MEQKATLAKFSDKKLGRGLSALLGESMVKSPLFNLPSTFFNPSLISENHGSEIFLFNVFDILYILLYFR